MNNLKDWLHPKIKERGLTVKEFGYAVGVSKAALYNYFQDRNRPDRRTMERICSFLGVPLEEGLAQYTPRLEGKGATKKYRRTDPE
jgi:transcriptional regulator with XRE-family HTH domain